MMYTIIWTAIKINLLSVKVERLETVLPKIHDLINRISKVRCHVDYHMALFQYIHVNFIEIVFSNLIIMVFVAFAILALRLYYACIVQCTM